MCIDGSCLCFEGFLGGEMEALALETGGIRLDRTVGGDVGLLGGASQARGLEEAEDIIQCRTRERSTLWR